MDCERKFSEGLSHYQSARYPDAERIAREILTICPEEFRAANLLGMALLQQERTEEGLSWLKTAVSLAPAYAAGHSNLGAAYKQLKQFDLALTHFELASRIQPAEPDYYQNIAVTLLELRRYEEAQAAYESALQLAPTSPGLWTGMGVVLTERKHYDLARHYHHEAIKLNPRYADAYNNLGVVLRELRLYREAVDHFARAIELKPDYAEAFLNRGLSYRATGEAAAACKDIQHALHLKPNYPDALYALGMQLVAMRDYAGADACFDTLLKIDPAYPYALGNRLKCALYVCNWSGLDRRTAAIEDGVARGEKVIDPFTFLAISDKPELHQKCARVWSQSLEPRAETGLAFHTGDPSKKIRVAYVSADFHEHATAYLTAGLFERHDKRQFEIIALSYGVDDGSAMRQRLELAFDRFIDVGPLSDQDIVTMMREMQIDIAVDLKGHTEHGRPGIFAARTAPIQVNYLGYPGTLGLRQYDYLIADAVAVPESERQFYDETIVYLPETYQPNDPDRFIPLDDISRAAQGLPEAGFVFCCFNNNYKITPDLFMVWMRLLDKLPGSVLWLLADNAGAVENLKQSASQCGIAPERLVFARRTVLPEHLARHRLADLFLDTLPYNAHTTASDALWMGLPVLTCMGKAFPGRVAASLLRAVGLHETIAADLDEYEALALDLALDQTRLRRLKAHLENNRKQFSLFDCDRYTRSIECAYRKMWESYVSGRRPETLPVPSPPHSR